MLRLLHMSLTVRMSEDCEWLLCVLQVPRHMRVPQEGICCDSEGGKRLLCMLQVPASMHLP